jgi:microcystin-dependent protein
MDLYIAQIILFAGNFPIRNFAYCNGQLLAISQNTALFSLIGTTYGGDGRTTFALPDLRGRVVVHSGGNSAGPGLTARQLGQRSGQERVTLNTLEMPSHNHPATATAQIAVSTAAGEESTSAGQIISNHASAFNEDATAGQFLGGASATATVGNNGGNQSHDNMQPWLALNYEICLFGIFPSRN